MPDADVAALTLGSFPILRIFPLSFLTRRACRRYTVVTFGVVAPLVVEVVEGLGLGSAIAEGVGAIVAGALADAAAQGANILITGQGSFNLSQVWTAGLTGFFGDDLVGDLGNLNSVADAVDDSLVGNVLETSLDQAASGFVSGLLSGGTLNSAAGQALQDALDGLTGGVADALQNSLISSTFIQDASSFLGQVSDAATDLPFVNSAVSGFFKDVITGDWSNLSFASFADSGASLLEQIAGDDLGNTPLANGAVSLLGNAVTAQLGGTSLIQSAFSFIEDAVANQLTGSSLAEGVGTFFDQIDQTDLSAFANTALGSGLATFLAQAVPGALDTSPLAQGIGSFLQQIAGSPSLDTSAIATGIGDMLQQAIGANVSINTSSLVTGVGDFLQAAQTDGVDLANSPLAIGLGDYLQQASEQATSVANLAFSNDLGSFLQQAVADGGAFLNSTFATSVGELLQQAAPTLTLPTDTSISGEIGSFLEQAATNYYQQYLLRTPDTAGLSFWVSQWQATGEPEGIKAGFADSPEFYNSAGGTPSTWLTALYQRILSRTPDPAGESFWLNYYQQQTAAGVAAGDVQQQIALGFFESAEAYGDDVTGWFNEYLGRNPSSSEQSHYVSQMAAGATDRTIEQEITNLPEYANNPPTPPDGTAAALPDFYQTTAQSQAVEAAKDALFASL